MRTHLVVDGERREVDVDLARGEAVVAGRTVPFRVVEDRGREVELEVGGERTVVQGWAPDDPQAGRRTLLINREVHAVDLLEVVAAPTGPSPAPRPAGTEAPAPRGVSVPTAPASSALAPKGNGVPITPPMPGKVLEVRVREGEVVAEGQTLVVLEAMKMRNEVQSPRAGKVEGLSVAPGGSVRAHEVMLRIVPG